MAIEVDLNLVRKYNQPGPRYTSYPTAPQFKESFDAAAWKEQIIRNNQSNPADLSLYFHIPFCDTLCWFCGCTMIVTRNREKIDEYIDYLMAEIDLVKAMLDPRRKVVQLHFGGGTPTHLSPEQIRMLGAKINESFTFADDAEVGCEMDPRELTRDHIVALREVGFNRASIGIQDFNPKVQKATNRIHSKELVQEVVGWIRDTGFHSLNFDLIYGLPFQTRESFKKTLVDILDLQPDRLAVYGYAHVPWVKKHQKLIHEENLPKPEEKLEMLKMIIETLTASEYVYIGMDHFAKEDNELAIAQREKTLQRNFQGYSTKAGADIYAFGMSSISQLHTAYAQNVKELSLYYQRVKEGVFPIERGLVLSRDDQIRGTVIMRLMCDMELVFDKISESLGIDFSDYFRKELTTLGEFEAEGLLTQDPEKIVVTEKGRLFIRNIAMTFDGYLDHTKARYSKTI
jgi:oxygen-independent coproporphyrinogen-3 oxidase